MAYPVGYEVHLRPLLTRLDSVGARLVQHVPVFLGNLGHRTAELSRHVNPYRKLDHSEPLVSALGAVPQQLLLIPRRVRPQHDLGHPNRQMSQSLLQHSKLLMARRHVTVSKLRVHHQVGLCPVGRERLIRPVLLVAVQRLLLVALHQAGVHVQRGLGMRRTALYEVHQSGVHLPQPLQSVVGGRDECSVRLTFGLLTCVVEPLQIPEHHRV